MDPNAALQMMRNRLAEAEGLSGEDKLTVLEEASDYMEALDSWLSNGGFLPDAWADPARV